MFLGGKQNLRYWLLSDDWKGSDHDAKIKLTFHKQGMKKNINSI